MKHLAMHYSTDTYELDIQNGKIYAIFPTGGHLVLMQTRLYAFMVFRTPTSVSLMYFILH